MPIDKGRSLAFSTVNDSTPVGGPLIEILGINFQGTGLTASDRVQLQDGNGATIVDYIVEGTADNADLWTGRKPQVVERIVLPNSAIDGTWVLTVMKSV